MMEQDIIVEKQDPFLRGFNESPYVVAASKLMTIIIAPLVGFLFLQMWGDLKEIKGQQSTIIADYRELKAKDEVWHADYETTVIRFEHRMETLEHSVYHTP